MGRVRRILPWITGLVIAAAGVMSLVVIGPHDEQLLRFCSEHQIDWFIDLLSESIFELETPGGGDLVVLFFIVTLFLYCLSSCADVPGARWDVIVRIQQWLMRRRDFRASLIQHRLQLEFLVVSAFSTSTLMVKTLKWVMARPRPKKILRGTRDFYEWFEFGPYFLDEGLYRASFPSGHTASAISLIGLAYVLVYSSIGRRWRVAGLFVFGGVVLFALLMATARVMTTAHWPSDVIFSLFGGWLLIHLLFFGYYYPLQLRTAHAVPETIETAAPPLSGIYTLLAAFPPLSFCRWGDHRVETFPQ